MYSDRFLTKPHGLVGFRFLFYQPNQTKPNLSIRKAIIKHMSPKPIFIETQMDTFIKLHIFSC